MSGLAPFLALKMSPPSSREAECSRGLLSSPVSKPQIPTLPSGSFTSTPSQSAAPPPKPLVDKGKGVVVAEKALIAPFKKRKDQSSSSDEVFKAFRESCSNAWLLQLTMLSPQEVSAKGSVLAAKVQISPPFISFIFLFLFLQSAWCRHFLLRYRRCSGTSRP